MMHMANCVTTGTSQFDRPRRRDAFTLVELLVVVSILALLLALLTPTLQRTRELARRSICRSNLHQWTLGCTLYARASSGWFPVAQPVGNHYSPIHGTTVGLSGFGIDTMYISGWKLPVGIGVVLDKGYVTDGRLADCPSSTHPYMRYDKLDTAYTNRGYGGWPAPGKPGPPGHRECSYQYRATIGLRDGLAARPPSIEKDPGETVYLADFWVYHCWHSEKGILGLGTFMHRTGYNAACIDGHVRWHDDPDEDMINASYSWYDWPLQEAIWRTWFEGRSD